MPRMTTGESIAEAATCSADMERREAARLVREMMDLYPWSEHPYARIALAIASRAILRGRHLTEAEKLNNLAAAMEEDPGETEEERLQILAAAAELREIAGKS